MSGQHPMNWGIDSNGETQSPTTETSSWYSDPQYSEDIETNEDHPIRGYLGGPLVEAGTIHVSTGGDLSPPLSPSLPPNNYDNVGWQAAAYSLTTNSPAHTPQVVAQVVAEDPNTYRDADYSDVDPNMHHPWLMRDGRSYRQHTRYQEQSLPSALPTTDTTITSSSSSSSPSLSSLSSSMVVNVGSVTLAEMQDQMWAEGQNIRMENRKNKVKRAREVATQSFATDDSRQPTPSMAINTWDKATREDLKRICIPSIEADTRDA